VRRRFRLNTVPVHDTDVTAATGFHSLGLDDETATELTVAGELPDWLSGALLRNGPGAFELGGSSVDHWFDGLAMVTRFGFDGETDTVTFRNRFLRTDTFESARAGEFTGGFATGETTLRERLWGMVFAEPYDNTNVITERVGDAYLALTETPRQRRFDPETLETTGDVTYDGDVPTGQITCAHARRDPETGSLVTFDTAFGRHNQYHVYEARGPTAREHVASVETDDPSYMHSFALTPNYVVLTEFPYVVNPLEFLKPGRQGPFVENFRWEPERGTRFRVVDRGTGEVVAEPTTDAFFGFHHANAYEDGDDLVVDLETVPDAESVATLSLERLRAGELDVLGGRIDRFRVSLGDRRTAATVDRHRLHDGTALPTVSPARWCREHRYVYAQRTAQPVTEWPTGVVKIDTETETATTFDDGADHFSEPIFVPRGWRGHDATHAVDTTRGDSGGADMEARASGADTGARVSGADAGPLDAGVVLTVGLDTDAERSRLFVLDGQTMTERARADLPLALPFDFHGRFFPELSA
jgi:beta-carotene 15,15'-monooxygenase